MLRGSESRRQIGVAKPIRGEHASVGTANAHSAGMGRQGTTTVVPPRVSWPAWNQQIPTVAWIELSSHLNGRLQNVVRFGIAEPASSKRVIIDAYYRNTAPTIAPFDIAVHGLDLAIEVQTHVLPPVQCIPRIAKRFTAYGIPFTGVHPGAAIITKLERGGICALLGKSSAAQSTVAWPTHLLTCGHMFPPGAYGVPVLAAKTSHGSIVQIGTLARNLLEPEHGALPVDAAVVELTPDGRAMAMAGGPGPVIRNCLPEDQVFGQTVRAFCPTRVAFSAATQTRGPFTQHVRASLWPHGFEITGVFGTAMAITKAGDSGGPGVMSDPHVALGSCSATDGDMSLFEPLERVLRAVAPMKLTLWRKA